MRLRAERGDLTRGRSDSVFYLLSVIEVADVSVNCSELPTGGSLLPLPRQSVAE